MLRRRNTFSRGTKLSDVLIEPGGLKIASALRQITQLESRMMSVFFQRGEASSISQGMVHIFPVEIEPEDVRGLSRYGWSRDRELGP
jgi:hypothetical protein